MRRVALTAGLMLLARLAFAQQASVTYLEGSVDLQPAGQDRTEAQIGDSLNVGDSIITGDDGTAQLQKQDTTQINVSPNTVFTLRQRGGTGGQKRDVLSVALGSITFSFNQLAGNEPDISTPSASAGIRGTVLTVYAGADGSSLFIVKSGSVAVQSGGKMQLLAKDEGVEVNPGQPPGEKFKILRGQVDYSTWNKQKLDNILLDPQGAALRVEAQMKDYIAQIDALLPQYNETVAELKAERAKRDAIGKEQGTPAMQKYGQEHVYPLELLASAQFLNLRYYALSAFSLKRFVLGRMYIRLASMYITDRTNTVYEKFMGAYRDTVRIFDEKVVPLLVPADI